MQNEKKDHHDSIAMEIDDKELNLFHSSSLLTTDNCLKTSIIDNFLAESRESPSLNLVSQDENSVLLTIDNLLAKSEATNIINKSEELKFQDLSDKYSNNQRNNSRLLVLDEKFASNLWDVLAPEIVNFFKDLLLSCEPLGFAVSNGVWEFEGLNEAFRINKYSDDSSQFFSPHKDSQYCPNGDRRSLLTLVIYLNENFKDGSTCFYFPKNKKPRKDVSVEEEILSSGGLDNGFLKFVLRPSVGNAVVFSQNILHESVPVIKGTKYILKTDIVVKRQGESLGFVVPEWERADYMQCLNYFREAQQQELQGNSLKAGELYERALSIRYCYPVKREGSSFSNAATDANYINALPTFVWHEVFNYLSGIDRENFVRAFPSLRLTLKVWERYRYIHDEKERKTNNDKYIPIVEMQYGIYTKFDFEDADFIWKNEDGCLRVAAMYAFFLLSHKENEQVYTVRYNPERQEVCAVSLRSLLTDVFLSRPCYGSVYAVRQTNPLKRCPKEDFSESVDQHYMKLRHGAGNMGTDLLKKHKVRTNLLVLGDRDIRKEVLENVAIAEEGSHAKKGEKEGSCTKEKDVEVCDTRHVKYCQNKDDEDDHSKEVDQDLVVHSIKCFADDDVNQDEFNAAAHIQKYDGLNDNEEGKASNTIGVFHTPCGDVLKGMLGNTEDESIGSKQLTSMTNMVNTESTSAGSYSQAEEDIYFINTIDKNDEAVGNIDCYEGDSESENSDLEVSDYEYSESDVDDIVENLRKHIQVAPDKDYFYHGYDTVVYIVSSACVLQLAIKQSTAQRTFYRYDERFPLRIHKHQREEYEELVEGYPEMESFSRPTNYIDALELALETCDDEVSVALISTLKQPTTIMSGSMCLCNWPCGDGYDRIRKACRTTFFNHLVFDFLTQELVIEKSKDYNCGNDKCYFQEYFDSFIKEELSSDEVVSSFQYCIDIESIIEDSEGFNHASCQCHIPAFKITEYFNLKSYPSLDHIHVVGGEKNGHVFVWTIYGGIAAL